MEWAVRTENLTRRFGAFTAVDNVNLAIPAGQVCGFLGPNGAGKSTTIRMLCGILEPTSGSGQILGYDLIGGTENIKRHIGYMSQRFSLYEDLRVIENLEFYAGLYNIPRRQRPRRLGEILEMALLTGRENEMVAVLSRGFRQRLALGCAIIAHPALVFLDEPTSGVSPTTRREFFNLIQQLTTEGTTVIVSTHFMDEAERCDQIAFFNEGRLMALDHPDILKQTVVQGVLLEVLVDNPLGIMDKIRSWPFVRDVNLHGRLLHVLVGNSDDRELLRERLGVDSQPIVPTLEDVFITLARREERMGA